MIFPGSRHYCVIYADQTILGALAFCFSFVNADNRIQLGVFVGVLLLAHWRSANNHWLLLGRAGAAMITEISL